MTTTWPIDGPRAVPAQPNNGVATTAATPLHSRRRRDGWDAVLTGEDSRPRRLRREVSGNGLDLVIAEAFGDLVHHRSGQCTAAVVGHGGHDALGRRTR